MLDLKSLVDIQLLEETHSVECKLAVGRHGKGALPKDFWPSYSAFANTEGGTVILGVKQNGPDFSLEGISDPQKVKSELFSLANNPDKVNVNLLTNDSVLEHRIEGKVILSVGVPRAPRRKRPVHLTKNPFDGNSYKRLNESDCKLSDEEVKRMIAEAIEDSRDDRLMNGYDIGDLNAETIRTYRQVFSNREPEHPWNALNERDFLRSIGGIRRDRESNKECITLAGLLMFGNMSSIQEALPNYMLDYQERPEARTEKRWVDRLTLDGKWSGNLYDFYRRVYLKLIADLKVPFSLQGGERKDETEVHIALREALANVIAHADYSDRASVLVVKRPDMFGFRNPGLMRVPVDIALNGGEADCRNRTIHKMLRLVGVGEQAGTGIPKIFQGWKSQHWSPPKLHEATRPFNQTLLELRMIDLFPPSTIEKLRSSFGSRFDSLSSEERSALALSAIEGTVSHARLRSVSSSDPVQITRTLQHLVQAGFLVSTGGGRGAVYHLPGQDMPTIEDVFGPELPLDFVSGSQDGGNEKRTSSSSVLPGSSSVLPGSSSVSDTLRDALGCMVSPQLPLPIIDSIEALADSLKEDLEKLATEPRTKGKLKRDTMRNVLLNLCDRHYLTLQSLAELVDRQPNSLRNDYLTPMVRDGQLSLAFPQTPTHERQAYCATASIPDGNRYGS